MTDSAPTRQYGALRVLTFRASAAELRSLDGRHLAFGVVMTWIVGMGRTWDDPTASAARQSGIGSLVYILALSTLLFVLAAPLRRPTEPKVRFGQLLTCVSLTAPPALLYGIPVERWSRLADGPWSRFWRA